MVEKDNKDFIFDFPRTEENAALFRSPINWEEEERTLEEEEKQNKRRKKGKIESRGEKKQNRRN